jgi:PAS domain S-box-containing protein
MEKRPNPHLSLIDHSDGPGEVPDSEFKRICPRSECLEPLVAEQNRELKKNYRATLNLLEDFHRENQAHRLAAWRLESVIEGTHVGTWEWNLQTGEAIFNAMWAQILGYSLEEIAPVNIKTWETFAHPEDLKQSAELLGRHFSGELPFYQYESRMKHKEGHWVWVHDRGKVASWTPDGKPLMMFGTHTDITERKRAEELMLREVHHRIKNNMNTIYGLLALQAMNLENPVAIAALNDASSRVQSMLILYEKLYNSTSFTAVSAIEYIPSLVQEIVSNFPNQKTVKIETAIEDFTINVKRLQPLGIIINELVTNIMKYAFAGVDHGVISVSTSVVGPHVVLTLQDNGIGMPASITFENSTGFGLTLVEKLTEQIHGTIRIERGHGTRIVIDFEM